MEAFALAGRVAHHHTKTQGDALGYELISLSGRLNKEHVTGVTPAYGLFSLQPLRL